MQKRKLPMFWDLVLRTLANGPTVAQRAFQLVKGSDRTRRNPSLHVPSWQ